ncbi:MAG TPA: glycoside hydrolase family 43 protein [Lacunisphaera sp.]|jgi:alpha-N-arabinofuranosidase|nr:glycoside hydrolase family 43 protein [Lacunisphaera sp.]
MTYLILPLFLATTALAAAPAPVAFESFTYTGHDAVFDQPLPAGHFRNPILAGYNPDPSICRVGDDYYLINSTFAHYPGIPIRHSKDLINWKLIGHVIDRPSQLKYDGLGISRGIFAPAISYHDGVFYVVCTMVDAGGNFVVTATNPAGPWSDPIWFDIEGIDPSLYFDDDGRAWLLNNGAPDGQPLYPGHRAIWEQEFDPKTMKLVGPRRVLVNGGVDITKKPVWIEGPHLYKRDGWYYLCCAEGGTGENHSQVILRSRAVTGPFEPWTGNPILTQRGLNAHGVGAVTSTGHADLVVGPDGNWWSVFLGCRPYADGVFYATGRETFLLPVQWTDDGWPRILPRGERVPLMAASPRGASVDPALPPLTGNFTATDTFDGTTLDPSWIMLRAPKETWWNVAGGKLSLVPRADLLTGRGNPSFLGQRLKHARFDATTELAPPATAGTSAGLAAFQNENHHYYFGVRRTAAGLSAFVERNSGKESEVLGTAPLPETTSIALRLSGDDAKLSFAYATQPGDWHVLVPDADAKVLTTRVAGGFVGAIVGLHARLEP